MTTRHQKAQVEALKKECLDEGEYLRRVGRVYGYPECCIEFFVQVWVPLCDRGVAGTLRARWLERQRTFNPLGGRIFCPVCLNRMEGDHGGSC